MPLPHARHSRVQPVPLAVGPSATAPVAGVHLLAVHGAQAALLVALKVALVVENVPRGQACTTPSTKPKPATYSSQAAALVLPAPAVVRPYGHLQVATAGCGIINSTTCAARQMCCERSSRRAHLVQGRRFWPAFHDP